TFCDAHHSRWKAKRLRVTRTVLNLSGGGESQKERTMNRLGMLTALALVIGMGGVAMASYNPNCANSGCVLLEPTVSTPLQGKFCSGNNCARPKPVLAPNVLACSNGSCATTRRF